MNASGKWAYRGIQRINKSLRNQYLGGKLTFVHTTLIKITKE